MPVEMPTIPDHLSENRSVHRGFKSAQKQTVQYNEITFDDAVEAVNPLNHLPFVSQLTNYSAEDTSANPVAPVARLIGGGLIGGPLGIVGVGLDLVFEEATGHSLLGNIFNVVTGEETNIAQATDSSSQASQRYQSVANAHKRHLHLWQSA